MIYIMTALYCEAQSLIQYYHLTKAEEKKRFQVFLDEKKEICLTVTGAGSMAAAVAAASVCTSFGAGEGDFLVNYGTCAGEAAQVGQLFLCNKIVEESTGRTFYPDMVYQNHFDEKMILTGAKMSDTELSGNILYDMEAAALYQAGSYFFGPHQMSFLKVVSDSGNGAGVAKDSVKQLMEMHLESVVDYIAQLYRIQQDRKRQAAVFAQNGNEIEKLCNDLHCSKVMELSLKQYLKYCMLADIEYEAVVEVMYREEKIPCSDKREGKKCLEELKRRLL